MRPSPNPNRWELYPFPGNPATAGSWLDETLTEDQKIALLKRLYEKAR